MTRGKYASTSDARRARETAESEVVAGRRKIVQLTTENNELREQLMAVHVEHIASMKRMRVMLAEGVSPELEAQKELQRRTLAEREKESRKVRDLADTLDRASGHMYRILRGLNLADAVAAEMVWDAFPLLPGNRKVLEATGGRLPVQSVYMPGGTSGATRGKAIPAPASDSPEAERVKIIQRARGER